MADLGPPLTQDPQLREDLGTGSEPFPVGTVFNPVAEVRRRTAPASRLVARFPSRLSAGSLDSAGIRFEPSHRYTAGEIVIAIDLPKVVAIEHLGRDGEMEVGRDLGRPSLIRHGEALARAAIGYTDALRIGVEAELELPHAGLGTSGGTIAAVVIAINELFGRPIPSAALAPYIAGNHGEECPGDDAHLRPVPSLGGAAVAALSRGALTIVAGEATVIGTAHIPERHRVVLAVPDDRAEGDAEAMIEKEVKAFPGFERTGDHYSREVAYRMVHAVLPALRRGDLRPVGELVFDHRFRNGSIENCAFSHPRLLEIARGVRHLFEDGSATLLGLSSAGPAFYAVTDEPEACRRAFEAQGMSCWIIGVHNGRYRVMERGQTVV